MPEKIKEEISGKCVSVVFDGTSRLGETIVVVLRYIDTNESSPKQKLVRLQLIAKSMC